MCRYGLYLLCSLYPQGEDCLNLNLWNNRADENESKPIMVLDSQGCRLENDPIREGSDLIEDLFWLRTKDE